MRSSMPVKLSISTISEKLEKVIRTVITIFTLTLERERQMGQLPNLTIIVVEDLILAIVLNHVLAD